MLIDNDLIPYACHVDDATVITKNDMLIQTVRFNTNLEDHDQFRQSIRYFISDNYSYDVAIYFHTIKLSKENKIKSYVSLPRFEHEIIDKIAEIAQLTSLTEVSFNVTFVTSVLPKNTPDFLLTFAKNAYYSRHEKFLKRAIKRLNAITDLLVIFAKDYNPKKLGIVQKDGNYESEHMNFLGKLINFTNYKYEIPIGSLCYSTLTSDYKFGKNVFKVTGEDDGKYVKIFTLKGYSEVPVDVIYQIIEKVPNIIISQAVIPIENTQLLKEYKKIAEIYRASTDEEFKNSSALEYMNKLLDSKGESAVYAKSQINISVIGESIEDSSKKASIIADIFAKTGIVAFTEDVHLQNAIFGTIPSNFRFLARLSNIAIQTLGGFAYSQGSDEVENSSFMWGRTLLTLKKTDKKRCEIGLGMEQRNMFINGKFGSGVGVMSSLLSIGAVKNEVNTLFIDIDNRFDAPFYLSGGSILNITTLSDEIEEGSIKINPFSSLGARIKDVEYVKNILKMMAGKNYDKLGEKLGFLTDQIIATNGSCFDSVVVEYGFSEIFKDWMATGKYGSIFNYSLSEDALSIGKNLKINIQKTVLEDKKLLKIVNFVILFKIINLLFIDKKFLISFNSAFNYLTSTLEAKLLKQIFDKTKTLNNVSFVFASILEASEVAENPVLEVVLERCEQKIFFSKQKDSNSNQYMQTFKLTKEEIDILSQMFESGGRSFLIKTPYDQSKVKFDLSDLNENLLILSDGSGIAKKLIKEAEKNSSDRRDIYKYVFDNIKRSIETNGKQDAIKNEDWAGEANVDEGV